MNEDLERRSSELVARQREYYDLRAPDYLDLSRPSDRKHRGVMTPAEVQDALSRLGIQGNVLELACGSGEFTKEIVNLATSVTAVDGSPKMLEINRSAVNDPTVEYVCADLFDWQPSRRFDFVFFGFWLSHVPPTHFDAFWRTVQRALHPGARCGFVDEDHRARGNELAVSDGDIPIATRTLSDGRSFDIVKVFWDAAQLEQRLATIGWSSSVSSLGETFLVGVATPPA